MVLGRGPVPYERREADDAHQHMVDRLGRRLVQRLMHPAVPVARVREGIARPLVRGRGGLQAHRQVQLGDALARARPGEHPAGEALTAVLSGGDGRQQHQQWPLADARPAPGEDLSVLRGPLTAVPVRVATARLTGGGPGGTVEAGPSPALGPPVGVARPRAPRPAVRVAGVPHQRRRGDAGRGADARVVTVLPAPDLDGHDAPGLVRNRIRIVPGHERPPNPSRERRTAARSSRRRSRCACGG